MSEETVKKLEQTVKEKETLIVEMSKDIASFKAKFEGAELAVKSKEIELSKVVDVTSKFEEAVKKLEVEKKALEDRIILAEKKPHVEQITQGRASLKLLETHLYEESVETLDKIYEAIKKESASLPITGKADVIVAKKETEGMSQDLVDSYMEKLKDLKAKGLIRTEG